jgi:hypothetical protein
MDAVPSYWLLSIIIVTVGLSVWEKNRTGRFVTAAFCSASLTYTNIPYILHVLLWLWLKVSVTVTVNKIPNSNNNAFLHVEIRLAVIVNCKA